MAVTVRDLIRELQNLDTDSPVYIDTGQSQSVRFSGDGGVW